MLQGVLNGIVSTKIAPFFFLAHLQAYSIIFFSIILIKISYTIHIIAAENDFW